MLEAVQELAQAMGGASQFQTNLDGVKIAQKNIKYGGLGKAHSVTLNANSFDKWTVVHELAHAWDGANGWSLSRSMQSAMNAGFPNFFGRLLNPDDPANWYDPGMGPPPAGVDANFNEKEDFAEAVAAFVYPTSASAKASGAGWPYSDPIRGYSYASYVDTPRGQYIQALMVVPP